MFKTISIRWHYTFAPAKIQPHFGPLLAIIGFILCGLGSSLVYLKICRLGDLRQQIPEFLSCYLTLAVLYFIASYISTQLLTRQFLRITILFSFLFRVLLLPSPPSLSDDVYRYGWEGYLQTKGINPYQFPPEAPELSSYRNEIWNSVNNKQVAAIYPPLTQLLNAITYLLFRSVWGFKIVFLIVDGLVIYILWRLLSLQSKDTCNLIFYAWNPLVVVETAGSGHNDVVVALMVLSASLFCLTNRPMKSVLSLSAAILSKFFPIMMVPFFLRRIPLRTWIWFPLTLFLAYLPFLQAGPQLFSALLYYREKWRFNGFLFEFLAQRTGSEIAVERIFLLVIMVLITGCVWRLEDLLRGLFWITGGILLLAPTLYPWYLIWIIPYLSLFPHPAWLLLTATSGLSYHILIDWWVLGIWQQNPFLAQLEYYPFFGLWALILARSILKTRRKKESSNRSMKSYTPNTVAERTRKNGG